MNILFLFVALIFAPIVGGILAGVDRKLSAHFQGRLGPPILQPFYDIVKLISKENIVVSVFQNIYIFAYLLFVISSYLMLFFKMDLLMIIFVYTIANVALIIGGMSTGSPYSRIGSQRETMTMLCYEPILLFFAVSIYSLTGSYNIYILDNIQKPLILYLPLIFLSMLFIMNIKFKKSPFDFSSSHHAHQELVKGMLTEFSGTTYALIEIAHFYETIFLLSLIFLFYSSNLVIGIILALFTYILSIIVDNITARLSWEWMLKFTYSIILSLCIINLMFIYIFSFKLT